MARIHREESGILFSGDLLILVGSLWFMLFIRYRDVPDNELFINHLMPFAILFVVWIIVFFIAGLYEKHTLFLKSKLPAVIFNAQIANSLLAVLFFYFIPYFGITPKINLFIYLGLSFGIILFWRIVLFPSFGFREKQNAIIIGSGSEMKELKTEVNNNTRYNINFISSVDIDEIDTVDFNKEIIERAYSENVSIIAVDLRHEKAEMILPHLYNLIFSGVRFIDMHKIYEDIFDRVPLSLLKYNWFLENISVAPKFTYNIGKRIVDVFLASVLGLASLVIYPFVILGIKLDDRGPIFITQDRIGKNNSIIKILKFRSMTMNDAGIYNAYRKPNQVTRFGVYLRRTRIDELPQLWNVIRGDISLIGPRPELPALAKQYEQEISYYNVRHLITPGLSGWAQIYHEKHPHHKVDIEETRMKLAYDLYYIKNRSLLLDLKIALRTVKTLLSRSGA